jgi:hypothetical protein
MRIACAAGKKWEKAGKAGKKRDAGGENALGGSFFLILGEKWKMAEKGRNSSGGY